VWLYDRRHGASIQEIAAREKLSQRRIRLGLARARAGEDPNPGATAALMSTLPRLVPHFPVGMFVPDSPCPHHSPYRVGCLLCCMRCHASGLDSRDAMQRSPLTDPKPEKTPQEPVVPKHKDPTRKEKRAILYGTPYTTPK
jgi:hypothetical protein